jgi:hypothetical protein
LANGARGKDAANPRILADVLPIKPSSKVVTPTKPGAFEEKPTF